MEKFFTVTSNKNPKISVHVAPGHFATGSAHRSHYIDIFEIKSSSSVARNAAREMAIPYLANTLVDVIVYMDGTEILAAYLADELLQSNSGVINPDSEIHIVTPMISADGHFIFYQNVQEMIQNKNVLLVVASMSTGATARCVLNCLEYYGATITGISAVFTAVPEIDGKEIHALFSTEDIPDYRYCIPSECEMCREGKKLDAVFTSEGYTEL
ncbi:MAG: phosphoribosyltransferase [Treponema sp.]|nr:phosphoribosyltransferase [Treponema sp.]